MISFGVILTLLLLIVLSVMLATPTQRQQQQQGQRFLGLQELLHHRTFNATWASEDVLVYQQDNSILALNISEKKNLTVLVPSKILLQLGRKLEFFSVSSDLSKVALAYDVKKRYRHSRSALYSIYDVRDGSLQNLRLDEDSQELRVEALEFVPNSSDLVLVANKSNLYLIKNFTVFALTTSGNGDTVFNGIADWLYEEELGFNQQSKAFWLNEYFVAMAVFNDTSVDEFVFGVYETSKERSVRYPRPGRNNPGVQLRIIELIEPSKEQIVVDPPEELKNIDHYLTGVKWASSDLLAVQWMNRPQNLSILLHCPKPFVKCVEVMRESRNDGWVSIRSMPLYDMNQNRLITLMDIKDGSNKVYTHIVMVEFEDLFSRRKSPRLITQGRFDVVSIDAWDINKDHIYYTATTPSEPGDRHLYLQHVQNCTTKCLSCTEEENKELIMSDDEELDLMHRSRQFVSPHFSSLLKDVRVMKRAKKCSFNKAHFGPGPKFFALECLGPNIPFIKIHNIAQNEELLLYENNSDLRLRLKNTVLPVQRDLRIPTKRGDLARVKLLLPPSAVNNSLMAFPLLIHVYGGPDTQSVSSAFDLGWTSYLVTTKDVVVVRIDGSGSKGSGSRFGLKHGLGVTEVEDQLEVVRKLLNILPLVDPDRVAVLGWSYGGFVALRMSVKEMIKCTVAIAPVTSWTLYDSAYTERYLGLPDSFLNNGYRESNILLQAKHLPTNDRLLLIHGTADDNVHVQHTLRLSRELVKFNKSFRQHIYPDSDHNLGDVSLHLHLSLDQYLHQCFAAPKRRGKRSGIDSFLGMWADIFARKP